MEPSTPRTLVTAGVSPTVRARSALVRAMRALDEWERHYLAGRGAERVAAYTRLMAAVGECEDAMLEAAGAAGRQRSRLADQAAGVGQLASAMEEAARDGAEDLAAGDHYAGMPVVQGGPVARILELPADRTRRQPILTDAATFTDQYGSCAACDALYGNRHADDCPVFPGAIVGSGLDR